MNSRQRVITAINHRQPDKVFEILNPVQTNTRDMDPATLKKEYGNEITFWGGGVDTATVLNNGTTGEVRKQVLERLEIFSKGGGYVFKAIEEFNS